MPESIKLISSMATRELLTELVGEYQRRAGTVVNLQATGGVEVARRVQAGEAADIVVLAADAIDRLIAAASIVEGSRVDLVRSGVAAAVMAGMPRPDISSESALKHTVLAATSVSFSTGPSGVQLEKLFQRWGILEQIRPRIIVPPPGTPVGSLVASGVAALGFQQLSELMNLPGIDVLGALPAAVQIITVFSGAICANATRPDTARELLVFLASAATAQSKRRHGMEAA